MVVLSKTYFGKFWTNEELNGLFSKAQRDAKSILPIWHNIDVNYLRTKSPLLAARVGVSSARGVHDIAQQIRRSLTVREGYTFLPYPKGARVSVIPEWGTIFIEGELNGESDKARMYDFGCHLVNPNKELRRFNPTTGTLFGFNDFVAFVLIHKGGITVDDIGGGVIRTIEGTEFDMAFVPIYSSEFFTLGIFNEHVAKAAGDYIINSNQAGRSRSTRFS